MLKIFSLYGSVCCRTYAGRFSGSGVRHSWYGGDRLPAQYAYGIPAMPAIRRAGR